MSGQSPISFYFLTYDERLMSAPLQRADALCIVRQRMFLARSSLHTGCATLIKHKILVAED
jgi:hypothetical protein